MSNNIFIDLTEELANKGWTVNWEFNSNIDPALLKYNNCTTYTECQTINPSVATDVENGAWNYRLDNLEVGGVGDVESHIYEGLFFMGSNTSNTSLVSFNVDLPNLTDGSCMFQGCSALTSWTIDLPNLTNGTYMFSNCTALNSWSVDLPNLTNGQSMFVNCTNLTSFSGDLSALTNGTAMFMRCTNLTSFSGDLSALTNGTAMFMRCTNLTSFSGDLSNLEIGGGGSYKGMFQNCSSLTSFSSDLSSLTNGTQMFGSSTYDCTKLDLASVQNIAETINDLTAAGTTGTIHIGISSSIQGNADLATALAAIRDKGWTVTDIYKS